MPVSIKASIQKLREGVAGREPRTIAAYSPNRHIQKLGTAGKGEEMIEVNRLNHKEFIMNCEWIETVEATPDTVITLTNGKKFVVAESVEEIIRKVIEYKQKVMFRYDN